jgi:hypothetical protein
MTDWKRLQSALGAMFSAAKSLVEPLSFYRAAAQVMRSFE